MQKNQLSQLPSRKSVGPGKNFGGDGMICINRYGILELKDQCDEEGNIELTDK